MYVLALDVSMGKSYVVIYHENTCLLNKKFFTIKHISMHLFKKFMLFQNDHKSFLKQRGFIQESLKLLSKESFRLLFIKPL